MSIETLKEDLKAIIKRASTASSSVDLSTEARLDAIWSFLQNDVLPFLDSNLDEVSEIDDAVLSVVTNSEDVLHTESAAVFAGLIASGSVLVRELENRIGGDQRLAVLIKEYKKVSREASELLEEVTIPDDPDDEDPEPDAPADGGVQ